MTIGFFAPLPLALMIPFMAGQSLIMGESFGKGYQYGKRKISSMSNVEFNKMSSQDLAVGLETDYKALLPALTRAVKDSDKFQTMVVNEMVNIPADLLKSLIDSLGGGGSTQTSTSASLVGETQQVRYTPSRDREGDKSIIDDAIKQAQKLIDDAYEQASQIGGKTFHNRPSNKSSPPKYNYQKLYKKQKTQYQSKQFGQAQKTLASNQTKAIAKFQNIALLAVNKIKVLKRSKTYRNKPRWARIDREIRGQMKIQKKALADVLAIYNRARKQ